MKVSYRKRVAFAPGYHSEYFILKNGDGITFDIPFLPVVGMNIYAGDAEIKVTDVSYDHEMETIDVYTQADTWTWKQGEEAMNDMLQGLEDEGWIEA